MAVITKREGINPLNKIEQRDFRKGSKPHRRPPESRALTDIELCAAVLIKPFYKRLMQVDQMTEREKLAAVGVTGQLQINTLCCCRKDADRLMGTQQLETVVRTPLKSLLGI